MNIFSTLDFFIANKKFKIALVLIIDQQIHINMSSNPGGGCSASGFGTAKLAPP